MLLQPFRAHASCHANADSGQGCELPASAEVLPPRLPPSPMLHVSYLQKPDGGKKIYKLDSSILGYLFILQMLCKFGSLGFRVTPSF